MVLSWVNGKYYLPPLDPTQPHDTLFDSPVKFDVAADGLQTCHGRSLEFRQFTLHQTPGIKNKNNKPDLTKINVARLPCMAFLNKNGNIRNIVETLQNFLDH